MGNAQEGVGEVLGALPVGGFVLEGDRLRAAAQDEWLLTIGNGGFAMGCPTGVPHRQYHGLLNAAWRPPTGRVQCVHSIEEWVQGAGPLRLVSFTKHRCGVEWVYEEWGVRITKSARVGWRSNTGAVRYRVEAQAATTVELRPNITLRDMHHALGETDPSRYDTANADNGVRVRAQGHTVALRWDRGIYTPAERLTEHRSYPTALARSEEEAYGERLWSPGTLAVGCDPGATEFTIAYALAPDEPDFGLFDASEREGHLDATSRGFEGDDRLEVLVRAADDFLVERTVGGRSLKTVIAGYPWFGDWGRDTMIALPGLMITTGRYVDARACLETFAAHESEGMIPNLFDDDDQPHYNTVDASLWFLNASRQLVEASGEPAGETILRACHAIIDGYRAGTRFGIGMDADGLVFAGDQDTQLTWMDAKREGIAFSPRFGKCVEINALWVNGLRCVASMIGDDARAAEYRELAGRASQAFNAAFVRPDGLGLYDRLEPDGHGAWIGSEEIRPNQLFAVSLALGPLDERHWASVVDVCREHLLTPSGMRTLSPEDPGYIGRFKGDMMQRDGAYHNGTVWPWPIGAYCDAVLRVGGHSEAARDEAARALRGLVDDLSSGCLGQIAEVYDGDPPRDQEGCCGQAWSVAEVLRVLDRVSRAV